MFLLLIIILPFGLTYYDVLRLAREFTILVRILSETRTLIAISILQLHFTVLCLYLILNKSFITKFLVNDSLECLKFQLHTFMNWMGYSKLYKFLILQSQDVHNYLILRHLPIYTE